MKTPSGMPMISTLVLRPNGVVTAPVIIMTMLMSANTA